MGSNEICHWAEDRKEGVEKWDRRLASLAPDLDDALFKRCNLLIHSTINRYKHPRKRAW
jgi:hypothetical protein